MNRFLLSLLCCFSLIQLGYTQPRDIAITMDDLPFVGEEANFHLNMIIDTIKSNDIPVTGFVIAGKVRPENWPVLERFKAAGLQIGNHSFSHANANQLSAEAYIQEIDAADKRLMPVLTQPKYFRFPYLAMGQGKKKESILRFLQSKKYQIAPITIDSQDFIFNQMLLSVPEKNRRQFLTVLKPCYLNFLWQQTVKADMETQLHRQPVRPHILLIHSNLLNAYVLGDIIELYRKNGYRFISLGDALA